MQKEKSDFKLDETAVNSWSYELMADNHLPEAIDLLYPGSGNAYDSMGEAYQGGCHPAAKSY
ncbi:MAG: hypothetical protein DMG57_14050 [Acidobacteria bacterium]|nr:MAG: hypothetical protein DMG57_14050 [Acidobacteriota bacterium]